jgi:CrcB protein
MSPIVLAGVGVLGGVGAIARLLLDGAVSARVRGGFPWGTLAVNLSGAFAFGVLVGVALSGDALRLAAIGFMGSYTTFSTWALESHRAAEDGRFRTGAANFAFSLVLGVTLAWLGRLLGGAL